MTEYLSNLFNLEGKTAEVDFINFPAEHQEKLEGRIFDVAINIASMQEMNEGAIQTYFSF